MSFDSYRLDAHIDPKNTGVLVVNLRGSGGGGANFTRDLAKQASGDENEVSSRTTDTAAPGPTQVTDTSFEISRCTRNSV